MVDEVSRRRRRYVSNVTLFRRRTLRVPTSSVCDCVARTIPQGEGKVMFTLPSVGEGLAPPAQKQCNLSVQRLLDVGDKIVGVFKTDGETNEVGRYACIGQFLIGHLAVSC